MNDILVPGMLLFACTSFPWWLGQRCSKVGLVDFGWPSGFAASALYHEPVSDDQSDDRIKSSFFAADIRRKLTLQLETQEISRIPPRLREAFHAGMIVEGFTPCNQYLHAVRKMMSFDNNLQRKLSEHEMGFQDLDTPERRQIVSGVAFLSADICSEIVWQRVREFVQSHPQFQCRISGGRSPEWKFDHCFDISRHCDEVEFGEATTEQALSFVSNAASQGLVDDRPPWRVALLRLTDDAGRQKRCAIAILAHHSLLDGLQGMKFFNSLLDGTERGAGNAAPSTDSPSDHLATSNPVMSAKCVRFVAAEMLRRRSDDPFASNGAASANRTTLAFTWSRRSFQTARRNWDASFQEVLLATLTDGLARYSHSQGISRNVRAILPLGRSEGQASSFTTNRHDVGFIELPTASAHYRRYAEIRQNLQFLRQYQEQGVFSSILGFMGRLPNAIRKAVAHRFAHQADLLISLIPGGRSRNTVDGAEVASVFAQPALPPRHSLVVGVTVTGSDVCVAVQADSERINRPDELRDCFEEAYRQTVLACVIDSET